MIECLSNPSWINPQIDFLLLLQNIRDCHFRNFDDLFLSITIVGEFWLPTAICAIVYWCIEIKSGIYLFSLLSFNMFFVHLFKMLACVYRPWVLSEKIQPVEKALAIAAGYSFPSGHSSQASAIIGGLAFLLRKKIWLAISLVFLVFLVGFSRMWLGVHTPQDVIVGFTIGFSLVFCLNHLVNWLEKDTRRYLYLFVIINLAVILVLTYLCYFNCYPTDYVNGELLVNTRHSIQTTIFCYGFLAGIASGFSLCRKYFPFNPNNTNIKKKIIRGTIGTIFIILLFKLGMKYLFCSTCDFKMVYILAFISGFFITALYPLIFSKFKI